LAALVVVAVALPGCAHVPDSGPPVAVPNRKLEDANLEVNAALVEPKPVGGPLNTVELLLDGARTTQNADVLGEAFLTVAARDKWKRSATDVWIFRPGAMTVKTAKTTATVTLTGTVVGRVNDAGVFQAESWRSVKHTLNLVRSDVWLLDTPPPAVLVRESEFNQAFQQVTLYFPARDDGLAQGGASGEALVPEMRFMDRSISSDSIVTAIVKGLIQGASPWLAPVTRIPLSKNTSLRGNVTIQGSDLVVDMSPEIESASAADINMFAAQVAWSQGSRLDGALRLQVNGRPINVDGVAAVQDSTHWTRYNPTAGTFAPLFYVHKGALRKLPDRPGDPAESRADKLGGAVARSGVNSAAVATNEAGLALVKSAPGGQALWLGQLSGELRRVRAARSISRPTWGGGQDGVLVAIDGRLHQADLSGAVRPVTIGAGVPKGPIRAVRLSFDGTRLAFIAGDGAAARAYVGLIQREGDGTAPVLRDARPVHAPLAKVQNAPLMAKVQDIGWSGPTIVAVAGQEADGTPIVREISVDGALEADSLRIGLRPSPITLAATPLAGSPQVKFVESDGQLYQSGVRQWSVVTEVNDVQVPFYPG
jgi:hypothetical protein